MPGKAPRFSFGYRVQHRVYFRDAVNPSKNPFIVWFINDRYFSMPRNELGEASPRVHGMDRNDFAALIPPEEMAALLAMSIMESQK